MQIAHPESDKLFTYPGEFYKSSESPCHSNARSPMIGEHNYEIFSELLHIPEARIEELQKRNII